MNLSADYRLWLTQTGTDPFQLAPTSQPAQIIVIISSPMCVPALWCRMSHQQEDCFSLQELRGNCTGPWPLARVSIAERTISWNIYWSKRKPCLGVCTLCDPRFLGGAWVWLCTEWVYSKQDVKLTESWMMTSPSESGWYYTTLQWRHNSREDRAGGHSCKVPAS